MESRENMTPAVETIAPEAPSSYQLAQRTDSPTAQIGNPSQTMGPLGFSPVAGGMPSSLAKKKRGRPRKYGPDGVGASGGASGRTLSPMPLSAASSPPTSGGYSDIKFGEPTGSGGEFQVEKKKKRKINSLEAKSNMSPDDRITSGGSFTPHMVTVNPGEGRFEILSLSGSFTPGEVGGLSSREGGMSIALSSPDGRVVGGLLGGLLTAAGPVQVVVASFLPEIGTPAGPKPKKKKDAIKLLTPVADPTTVPRTTNTDHQNFNDKSQESPAKGNTNSTPASNFQHENRSTGPNVHDWRRAATDMNVSLRED
ncbi:protein of unknown function DUF296 [Cynara cardunculus var. scolymus]|uniref:AT-hook motif nuclear-localized protein n=1 Tax=Cynara cardunculus var. scolymus TaxID=59895 RepID=A0A103XID3_CYNCS|nr:protein of unknown function DUF296 [Cynara cardunculus var. scolymus]